MMHSLNFLLSNVIPMPRDVSNFFKENEIVPTSILEDKHTSDGKDVDNKDNVLPIKKDIEFKKVVPDNGLLEIKSATAYSSSIEDFVTDTFSETKVMIKKDALMRKVIISASENDDVFPYQVKVNHAIFDTLEKMNDADEQKFKEYAENKGYLMSDEVAYMQDIIWNTI